MLVYENIHSIRQLVEEAAVENKGLPFIRYVEDGEIKDITFDEFAVSCKAVTAWVYQRSRKVGHRLRVAMMSSNTPLYVHMLLGVVCGGGVAIPMDPQMPMETVCGCLNKAEADILIYEPGVVNIDTDMLHHNCPNVSRVMHMSNGKYPSCTYIFDNYKDKDDKLEVSDSDCAMILFTSGTTGEEKGVMLSNGNLVDSVFNTNHDKGFVKVNILPMNHAFCLNADILLNFPTQATVCMNGDTSKLAENLLLFKPSLLSMVPMVAQALYNKLLLLSKEEGKSPAQLKSKVFGPNLVKVITGGAHLPAELVDKYREIGIFLCQGYGMTECSPTIASPDMSRPDKAHTAGKVVLRCETRVVKGELQVKSPSVMMGYVNAPQLTAEVITKDGWLRTGDIGMEDEEGFLHITGRKKNLIILSNGANVSPEQIENLILDHQLIEETLVYGEGNTIVAEVYPNHKYGKLHRITDVKEEIDKIIAQVNSNLQSYKKVMKVVIRKSPFKRTSTNKIIRNQRANASEIYSSDAPKKSNPTNETQLRIFNIVADVLGHKNFGIDTDLFSVGMDSLGCVLTLTAFSENMDFYLELDQMMENATIEKLEKLYTEQALDLGVDFTPREVYPLTKVQKYFAYVIRGNTTGNIPYLFKLSSSIDFRKMKSAIAKLFKIHPILSDVVQMTEQGFANFRDDSRKPEIPVITLNKAHWKEKLPLLVRPYTYSAGEPLYHIELYKVGKDKYLFFDIAHIISDGATLGILIDHLNRLYLGEVVKDRKFSYYDYILDNEYRTENGLNTPNISYFMKLMDGFKIKRSILNRQGHQDMSVSVNAAIHDKFKGIDKTKVKEFCARYAVSENVFFLTIFNMCIGIFANDNDTISTSIHNGRTDSRWGRVAGCFFVTYNFRAKFTKKMSLSKALSSNAKQIMDTMCCRMNNLHADEMFFQYQGDLLDFDTLGGAEVEHIPLQLDSLPFHLMVHLRGEEYRYELRYWENRFEREQLNVFMDVFDALLAACLEYDTISQIRKHIPSNLLTTELNVPLNVLKDAGCEISDNSDEVSVKIVDNNGYIQPIGAWGKVLASNNDTGKIGRIMVDGTLDFLKNSGRRVMFETLFGRDYPDLEKMEKLALSYDGITDAQAYVRYGDDNQLHLTIDVKGENICREQFKSYLEDNCEKFEVPSLIIINDSLE